MPQYGLIDSFLVVCVHYLPHFQYSKTPGEHDIPHCVHYVLLATLWAGLLTVTVLQNKPQTHIFSFVGADVGVE